MPKLREQEYIEFVEQIRDEDDCLYDITPEEIEEATTERRVEVRGYGYAEAD